MANSEERRKDWEGEMTNSKWELFYIAMFDILVKFLNKIYDNQICMLYFTAHSLIENLRANHNAPQLLFAMYSNKN